MYNRCYKLPVILFGTKLCKSEIMTFCTRKRLAVSDDTRRNEDILCFPFRILQCDIVEFIIIHQDSHIDLLDFASIEQVFPVLRNRHRSSIGFYRIRICEFDS